MKKANGILVFGILFIVLSIVYTLTALEINSLNPTPEMILRTKNQLAFIKTTFWSGIIMIVISIFLMIKAKRNSK